MCIKDLLFMPHYLLKLRYHIFKAIRAFTAGIPSPLMTVVTGDGVKINAVFEQVNI